MKQQILNLAQTTDRTAPALEKTINPLLADDIPPAVDMGNLKSQTILARPNRRTAKREIRDVRRIETAAEALAPFNAETEIWGFTKGQFSVVDILRHLLHVIGPADLIISTWTASRHDINNVLEFVETGQILSARWLVDLTFQRRAPELAHRIRETFGKDAIRVAKNHAKWAAFSNADGPPTGPAGGWKVCLFSSMNLNSNPKFENFHITHDPELHAFHDSIVKEIWSRQKRTLADANPYAIERHFETDM